MDMAFFEKIKVQMLVADKIWNGRRKQKVEYIQIRTLQTWSTNLFTEVMPIYIGENYKKQLLMSEEIKYSYWFIHKFHRKGKLIEKHSDEDKAWSRLLYSDYINCWRDGLSSEPLIELVMWKEWKSANAYWCIKHSRKKKCRKKL